MTEPFESTELTRYVKVFVAEEDMFTVTFCDYRGEPLSSIPRSSIFKTNQAKVPQEDITALGALIEDWILNGIDGEGNCVEDF
jgi:hypothetical protein